MFKSLIQRIHDRVTADSEADSEPEGYLSYRTKWHAAAWGFGAGFFAILMGRPELLAGAIGWLLTSGKAREAPAYIPYPKQYAKESAYVIGHMLAGATVAFAVRPLRSLLPSIGF